MPRKTVREVRNELFHIDDQHNTMVVVTGRRGGKSKMTVKQLRDELFNRTEQDAPANIRYTVLKRKKKS